MRKWLRRSFWLTAAHPFALTCLGIPPNRGHGDVSLAQEGDWRMILRKDKVEIGNSG